MVSHRKWTTIRCLTWSYRTIPRITMPKRGGCSMWLLPEPKTEYLSLLPKTPLGVYQGAVERSEKLSQRYAARRVENRPLLSNVVKDRCPICSYPMQLRWNKNYGLRLWICTNDQEICGFMTNDKRGGELSIQKCDWCKDGYLVVKKGRTEYILGCTNYKPDKSGCGRLLSQEHYRAWRKDDFGVEDLSKDKPAYFRIPESSAVNPQAPEMISVKTNTTRKSAAVHTDRLFGTNDRERRV